MTRCDFGKNRLGRMLSYCFFYAMKATLYIPLLSAIALRTTLCLGEIIAVMVSLLDGTMVIG